MADEVVVEMTEKEETENIRSCLKWLEKDDETLPEGWKEVMSTENVQENISEGRIRMNICKNGVEILPARSTEEAKNTKKTTIDVEDEA